MLTKAFYKKAEELISKRKLTVPLKSTFYKNVPVGVIKYFVGPHYFEIYVILDNARIKHYFYYSYLYKQFNQKMSLPDDCKVVFKILKYLHKL